MAELRDTINISGLSALGDVLQQMPLLMREKVATKAMLAAATVGRDSVQATAPVGKPPDPHIGNLRDHIRMARRKDVGEWEIQYVVYVKTTGWRSQSKGDATQQRHPLPYYWYYLEFGTSKMDANPFMLRGFEQSVDNAGNRARDIAAYWIHRTWG